jgi:cell division transport system permease protein
LWWLSKGIQHVTALYQSDFLLTSLELSEFGYLLVIAVTLGLLGSYLAVRSQLRAISPG